MNPLSMKMENELKAPRAGTVEPRVDTVLAVEDVNNETITTPRTPKMSINTTT